MSDNHPMDFEKWRESSDSAAFAGQHVAFHPTKGVLAASRVLGDILESIDEIDPMRESVIGFVPFESAS